MLAGKKFSYNEGVIRDNETYIETTGKNGIV